MKIGKQSVLWYLLQRRRRRFASVNSSSGITVLLVDSSGRRIVTSAALGLRASFAYFHLEDDRERVLVTSQGAILTAAKA